jgi:hypothetical protein
LTENAPYKACSAFTRVAACTLALPPIRDTLIEGFSHFVASMTAPIASGWSGCRVGLKMLGRVEIKGDPEGAVRLQQQFKATALGMAAFLALSFPPRRFLLKPWLTTTGLAMIDAVVGHGKT